MEVNDQFAPESIERALSVLDRIKPLSRRSVKQGFKGAITGSSGRTLVLVLIGYLAALIVGGFIYAFFPHPTLDPVFVPFLVFLGAIYSIHTLLAAIVEWKKKESLAHPDYMEERKHAVNNIQKLLADVQDKALLEEMLIEIRRELEDLKDTSSTFTAAIKDISPLLLAVVAIMAIQSNQQNESVSLYPIALQIGALGVIVALVLKLTTFRRIRLYSYWSYIVEKTISQVNVISAASDL